MIIAGQVREMTLEKKIIFYLSLQGVPERMDLLFLFNHSEYIESTRTVLNFLKFVVHPGYFTYNNFSEINL